MSDERIFRCYYCDDPCTLIMEGMSGDDDEDFVPVCCPYDGSRTKDGHWHWQEVDE